MAIYPKRSKIIFVYLFDLLNYQRPDDESDIYWAYEAYLTHLSWRFQNIGRSKRAKLTNEQGRLVLEFKVDRDQLQIYKQPSTLYASSSIGSSRMLLICRAPAENRYSRLLGEDPALVELQPHFVLIQSNSKHKIPLETQNLQGKLPQLCNYLNYYVSEYDDEKAQFKNKTEHTLRLILPDGHKINLCTRLVVDKTVGFRATVDSYIEIYSENDEDILEKINIFSKVEDYFNFIFASQYKAKIFTINQWQRKRKKRFAVIYMMVLSKHQNYQQKDGQNLNSFLLFTNQDIPDTTSAGAIANWIENYALFEDVVDVISILKTTVVNEELRFSLLINALESTHRKNFNRLKQNQALFNNQRNRILDQIESREDRDLVAFHLTWANEVYLIERLRDINDIAAYYGMEPLRDSELIKIKNTRNYLVHKDASIKPKAYKKQDLYFINIVLAHFSKIITLHLLNFTREEIIHIVQTSAQLDPLFYRDEPLGRRK